MPMNFTGTPVTWRMLSAAPPRASPSILVRIRPVVPTLSWNSLAAVTASWPAIASATKSTSCGLELRPEVGDLFHHLFVDVQAAGGIDEQVGGVHPLRLLEAVRGDDGAASDAGAFFVVRAHRAAFASVTSWSTAAGR